MKKAASNGRAANRSTRFAQWAAHYHADELADPQNLAIRTWVNGELRQDANTGFMISGVAQLIAFISQGITLMPGDIIASGTPAGVGHYRTPPTYWRPGDTNEIEIEGLGRLANPVL